MIAMLAIMANGRKGSCHLGQEPLANQEDLHLGSRLYCRGAPPLDHPPPPLISLRQGGNPARLHPPLWPAWHPKLPRERHKPPRRPLGEALLQPLQLQHPDGGPPRGLGSHGRLAEQRRVPPPLPLAAAAQRLPGSGTVAGSTHCDMRWPTPWQVCPRAGRLT